MYLYLNSSGAVVRALCAFLSCSLLTTTVFTHVFIEQINDDDDVTGHEKAVKEVQQHWLSGIALGLLDFFVKVREIF